jgi:hypothetical protein
MIRSVLAALVVSLTIGCGGGGIPAPKPLKLHYDEVYIAQFSLEEKSEILKAQNEYHRARAEQMKAEAELSEIATKIKVAQNERKQSALAEQSAKTELKSAEQSGDMNRVNAEMRNVRAAELERKAADDKIAALKARHKYLKLYVHYATEETYHREARFELAKATLGNKKNIAPKGFKYSNYKKQVDDRSRLAQKSKHRAKQEEQKSKEKHKIWQARVKEAQKAKGVPSASDSTGSTSTDSTN